MAIGAAKVGTLKEQATGTTLTATLPAGLAAGDFLLITGASETPSATPAGYTLLFPLQLISGTERLWGYYKIAGGSETAASITVPTGRATAIYIAFSGVDNTTPLDVTSQVGQATGNVTLTGLTIVTAGAMLLGGQGADASTASTLTVPTGMTQYTQSTGTGRRFAGSTQASMSAGATGSRAFTQTGGTLAQAAYLAALRPAASAVTPFAGWGIQVNL